VFYISRNTGVGIQRMFSRNTGVGIRGMLQAWCVKCLFCRLCVGNVYFAGLVWEISIFFGVWEIAYFAGVVPTVLQRMQSSTTTTDLQSAARIYKVLQGSTKCTDLQENTTALQENTKILQHIYKRTQQIYKRIQHIYKRTPLLHIANNSGAKYRERCRLLQYSTTICTIFYSSCLQYSATILQHPSTAYNISETYKHPKEKHAEEKDISAYI